MERYDLTYKYSKDNGLTFIDITEIVNSAQTSIVHNICSAGFKSATDTASFTIPAKDTALKQNLINALLDGSTVLVRILEGDNVIFTGYVNKDNISIRSYPLTASITIEVEDVGTLNLDNKVNEYVYYKNYTITELVHALLTKAGYTYDNSSLATGDEQTLEAFVIDKDNSNTFREYIDTLLFEAGGYVLDFNAQGIASIVKLNWQATGDATLVDNPMDSEGITTKTKILDVDGVSLTWASTKWSDDNNQLLWQDSISRKLEDNYVVGEDVENQHYWPADGELNPIYQEYNSELLDTDYLTNASRKQNEDLAIIVAEDIRAEIQATKNKAEFTSWEYPLIQDFIDNYDLTINPIAYPKKAWYLLYNDSGETVNIQHFRLYGKVFYKDKKHTLKTKETKNPKEYESQYIYNETHANQFLQFYWHFMQTSRISVTWKEVGANHTLGDVVQVYHKGSLSYVKAIVAGITTTFIGKTKITSYSAVGVASQIIPYPTLSITKLRGSTQAENRGIDNVKVQYATSITQTGTKTSYQDVMPTLHPYTAKYLWQKETIYYTDGTKDVFEDIIAVYGDKGDAGDGITAQYCYSTSPTECTGGTLVWNDADIYWGEEQGVWNWWTTQTLEEEDGLYIWLRTKVGDSDWVYTRLTGVQGLTGNGIVSIVNHYLKTSLSSGVTKDTAGWTETIQTVTATERYLWNYETINYTEGEPTDSAPCIIGTYGNGIASITEYYQVSDSNTEAPTSWVTPPQEIPPMTADNRFLWNYEKITYNDGTYKETVKRVIGAYGESGTPARVCTISCDKSVVIRNDRLTTSEIYTFTIEVQGYSATPSVQITVDGTSTTLDVTTSAVSDTTWYAVYSQALLNAKAITAKVYLDDVEMDTITLGLVDETERGIYQGVFESTPTAETGTRFIKGDSYFNSTDNLLYAYGTHEGATGWYLLSEYTTSELSHEEQGSILAKGMSDALNEVQEGSVTRADYAYLNNLIVSIITANYISSQKIQLKEDGVIASSGISTETTEDIDDTTGLLNKEGFRFENDGSLRANKLFLGLSSGNNKIIIDNTSIRCVETVDGVTKTLWELLPNGSIVAYNLKAKGDIIASSLSCNALTTQEPAGNKVFQSSETPFTKTLYSSSEVIQWIIDKYTGNTIPASESAFISSGWTYNGKTINHIALGVYAINQTIEGEGSDGRALVLGKQYYNSKTISAGNNKFIIQRMVNNYSFPIWVYADVSLGGNMNEIHSTFCIDANNKFENGNDQDAWCCLMPNQGIDIYAHSSAWWGSQTAKGWIRVYPTYKDLCFVYHPVQVLANKNGVTYTGSEGACDYKLCDITLPAGHPNTIAVVLNGMTVFSSDPRHYKGLASSIVYFKATNGTTTVSCSASLAKDDNLAWVWLVSGIPSDATKLELWVDLYGGTEERTDEETGEVYEVNIYYNLKIYRLVYAICYNYEAHNALIRYDNGSLQYIGSKRSYVQGTFSEKVVVSYASSSIYNQIKMSLGVENGEYDITTEDTTVTVEGETETLPATSITLDGTTYTGMSKMIVADTYISFWGDSTSVIIYSSGYNSSGRGSANDGGWYGDTYLSAEVTISVLTQPLGASTALLFPKANNTYDLGEEGNIYRTLYVNDVKSNHTYGAVFN